MVFSMSMVQELWSWWAHDSILYLISSIFTTWTRPSPRCRVTCTCKHVIFTYHKVFGTSNFVGAEKSEKLSHLKELQNLGPLKIFQADLRDEGSFDDAVAGCDYVFYVAAPVNLNTDDPEVLAQSKPEMQKEQL